MHDKRKAQKTWLIITLPLCMDTGAALGTAIRDLSTGVWIGTAVGIVLVLIQYARYKKE